MEGVLRTARVGEQASFSGCGKKLVWMTGSSRPRTYFEFVAQNPNPNEAENHETTTSRDFESKN